MDPPTEIDVSMPEVKPPMPDKKRLKKMFSWTDDGLWVNQNMITFFTNQLEKIYVDTKSFSAIIYCTPIDRLALPITFEMILRWAHDAGCIIRCGHFPVRRRHQIQ